MTTTLPSSRRVGQVGQLWMCYNSPAMKLSWLLRPLAMALAAGLTVTAQQAPPPNTAAPPRQSSTTATGVSAERFQRLHQGMQGFVDRKEVSGIVTLVTRDRRNPACPGAGAE